MVRFNVNMPDDLHKQFKLNCVAMGKDMSEVIRELIRDFLERSEEKIEIKKR